MRLALAIVLGVAAGAAVAWWASRDEARARVSATSQRPPADGTLVVEDTRLRLYRWRDDAGRLQVTDQPPKGRRYETVDRQPRDGIEVHGDRE